MHASLCPILTLSRFTASLSLSLGNTQLPRQTCSFSGILSRSRSFSVPPSLFQPLSLLPAHLWSSCHLITCWHPVKELLAGSIAPGAPWSRIETVHWRAEAHMCKTYRLFPPTNNPYLPIPTNPSLSYFLEQSHIYFLELSKNNVISSTVPKKDTRRSQHRTLDFLFSIAEGRSLNK